VTPGRLAVLDVGSNSLRLFCCEGVADGGPAGKRWSTVIGLRRDAAADGTLRDEALARLEAALTPFAERARAFAPERTIAVCTSAVRDAPNRSDVVDLLRDRAGADVHILPGGTEASLAFAGAALAVDDDRPVMVIDVGGGSTELVTGAGGVRRAAVSLQLGAVRQTDRHVRGDPPAAAEVAAVRADARAAVTRALPGLGETGSPVAVAGTATTLAAIDLGGYDPVRVHRHRLTRTRVDEILALLASLPLERRRELPGLDPARAGVITAGAAILATVLEVAGANEVMISERDILDGVALAAAGRLGDTFQL
jgi:exopolyphosphatase/guanosine-5'-triphosphate,3'-diphosphate pyrophosphatase